MASWFMMLLLLTCTITWTPQCAAGRITEGTVALPLPVVDNSPVPIKHAKSEQKIVGVADIVKQGTVNYNARIYIETKRDSRVVCTGTLINSKQVLTAGHCCLNSTVIVVTLSAYNLEANPPEEGVRNYTAVDKLLPGEYLKDRYQFKNWDVCILILPEDVNIRTIRTAPIVGKSDQPISSGTGAYVYGWGIDNDIMQTEKSKFLGTTRLGGMNIATLPCSKFAGKTLLGEKVQVTEVWGKSKAPMFLCSAPREDVGLCDGDSGAPLLVDGVMIGIFVESHWSNRPEGRLGCKAPTTYLNIFINIAEPFTTVRGQGVVSALSRLTPVSSDARMQHTLEDVR